jgi:hypothetical protein
MVALEPHISLLEKFDGTRPKFEALSARYALSCNYTPVVILMTPLV